MRRNQGATRFRASLINAAIKMEFTFSSAYRTVAG